MKTTRRKIMNSKQTIENRVERPNDASNINMYKDETISTSEN